MYIFRVDVNETISAGHVMRCLAIADELRSRGIKCLFVSSDDGIAKFVKQRGFSWLELRVGNGPIELELPQMLDVLRSISNPVVVVDTYKVTREYLSALAEVAVTGYLGTKPIEVIGFDYLVNYSLNACIDDYTVLRHGENTMMLIGAEFVPLRREFRGYDVKISKQVSSILLTSGNTDQVGVVPAIASRLGPLLQRESLVLNVVVGPLYRNNAALFSLANEFEGIRLLTNVSNMAEVMRSSDLAISACGTTLYELAACGIPTIGFSLAPEQDSANCADRLAEKGLIRYIGKAYTDITLCANSAYEAVCELKTNYFERLRLACAFHRYIDGEGSSRICDALALLESSRYGG